MAQRRFGNVISSRLEGNDRENVQGRSKLAPQRASSRATLGDLGNIGNNVGALNPVPGKVCTKSQKELNVHSRRGLHKSKGTSSLLSKDNVENEEEKKRVPSRSTEPMDLDSVKDVVEEVSEAFKCVDITDIDAEDFANPQMCAEYANEIYRYLLKYEKEFAVSDYMKVQKQVNERMRSILIDWLVQVHDKFRLLQETLHLTVAFVDRYLAKEAVPRNELQLIGVTAMLLASKYEEMYAPEIGDFVFITDNAYDKATIRKTEAKMFAVLDHKLGDPLCLHFLRRNSKACKADGEVHTMAKYFMELMLVDYESMKFFPSQKAAAALCLALKLQPCSEWCSMLEHYSTYTEESLKECVKRIAQLVLRAKNKESKLTAVTIKYSKHKFFKISLSPALDSDELFSIADLTSVTAQMK